MRIEIDVDRIVRQQQARLVRPVGRLARALRDDIVGRIQPGDDPSDPGEAPASPGPYRRSWKTTRVRVRRHDVVSWVFSLAKTSQGRSLAEELERGDRNAPRPHYRPAAAAVQSRAASIAKSEL